MLNLKNTLDGYLKNVEVIGNTVQDTNNLANIRSVGDKVEGQELYKIPVVSCGKNLFKMCKDNEIHRNSYNGIVEIQHNGFSLTDTRNGDMAGFVVKCKPNTEYVVTFNDVSSTKVQKFFRAYTEYPIDSNANYNINVGTTNGSSIKLTTTSNCNYIFFGVYGSNGTSTIKDIQVEESTQATPYEPYQEQKLEILSPVQLEKVGDVVDRIICKDGVWGVEKHIETILFNGSENWRIDTNGTFYMSSAEWKGVPHKPNCVCITDIFSSAISTNDVNDKMFMGNTYLFMIKPSGVVSVDEWKSYLSANNLKVKFVTTRPQFIPLPYDQQVKLRTFAGQTNIFFNTEIAGQIKAQVPKSLGATVNTHTEQIADLHNSLDRVKKLDETTVSTVETESNFTTVDATSNGYFEDVKLEGKTLVNHLCNSENTVSSTNATSKSYVGLQAGKTYTAVVNVIENNNNKTFYPFRITYSDNSQINIPSSAYPKGSVITYKFELADKGINFLWVNWCANYVAGDIITTKTLLLEGDHTNNPPEYFEGLMSVGQDVEEVSVESVTGAGNLIKSRLVFNDNENVAGFTDVYRQVKIPVIKGRTYYLKARVQTNSNWKDSLCRLHHQSKSGTHTVIYNSSYNTNNKLVDIDTSFIVKDDYVVFEYYNNSNLDRDKSIYDNFDYLCLTSNPNLEPKTDLILDKKPLLYYNPTTETWEKPILREWDTIEKHSDGKYYYHKRSEEVVLNGSESSWGKSGMNHDSKDILRFYVNANAKPSPNHIKGDIISDTFITNAYDSLFALNVEGIDVLQDNKIGIGVLKSKLITQDVAGFKAWLKDNPTTVVYQLEQEEVYECTNIDLMTYSGETNYIINSGAISPKSLLKVHNNISNVVKILQEKVSLLENTFIAGLKSVLSGDMYSLATILYPEDFEQNDNTEQDIMVIPE